MSKKIFLEREYSPSINICTVKKFYIDNFYTNSKLKHRIVFIYGGGYDDQWEFDTKEEAEKCYTKIKKEFSYTFKY